jgi:probable F420-dependent oxidoreductase
MRERIGKVGVWAMELRFGDPAAIAGAAAELDGLGYGAIWVPGGIGGDITGDIDRLLDATERAVIATGIINIWKHEPEEIAGWWKALPTARAERVLLGVGVSHGPLIGEAWAKPLAKTRDWLEKALVAGIPAQSLCVAALGPKMLELSGELTAGAHPYLITPEHTAEARAILGPDRLLAPEQGVIPETDPARARDLAREALVHYRRLPNYMNSWKRLGFTDAEIEAADDRLLDALFAWGDAAAIAARVKAHHDAGADHVCIQAITGAGLDGARQAWADLAKVLL